MRYFGREKYKINPDNRLPKITVTLQYNTLLYSTHSCWFGISKHWPLDWKYKGTDNKSQANI